MSLPRAGRLAGLAVQTVLVVVAAVAALTFLAPTLLGGQGVTVLSGSMAPAYPAGSAVVVRPVRAADVRPGDVISFVRDDVLVTHRVVAVGPGPDGSAVFTTKGDGNEDPDAAPVPAAAVRGKVAFGVPLAGWLQHWLRRPAGFGLLVGLPALLVLASKLASLPRGARRAPVPQGVYR